MGMAKALMLAIVSQGYSESYAIVGSVSIYSLIHFTAVESPVVE